MDERQFVILIAAILSRKPREEGYSNWEEIGLDDALKLISSYIVPSTKRE
jgi:hypothetical protein